MNVLGGPTGAEAPRGRAPSAGLLQQAGCSLTHGGRAIANEQLLTAHASLGHNLESVTRTKIPTVSLGGMIVADFYVF